MTTKARLIYLWKVVYSRLYPTLVFDFLLDFSNSDSTALIGKDTYVSPCKVCPVKDQSYLVVSIASYDVWKYHCNLKRTFFLLNARTGSLMAFFYKIFKAAASSWVSRQVDVAIRRGLICLTCHTFCSEGKNKHSLNQYIPVAMDCKEKRIWPWIHFFYHFSSQTK